MIVNIFGSSERIEEMEAEDLKSRLKSCDLSIGVNSFFKYYNCDYGCFLDISVLKRLVNNNLLYEKYISNLRFKGTLYNKKNIFYDVLPDSILSSGYYAIKGAIKLGAKKINLYGIMDGDYTKLANGDIKYYNCFKKGYNKISSKNYKNFNHDIENNFYSDVIIERPLRRAK